MQGASSVSCTCKEELLKLSTAVTASVASLESSIAGISSKVDHVYAIMRQSKQKLQPATPSSSALSSETESGTKEEGEEDSKFISVRIICIPLGWGMIVQ